MMAALSCCLVLSGLGYVCVRVKGIFQRMMSQGVIARHLLAFVANAVGRLCPLALVDLSWCVHATRIGWTFHYCLSHFPGKITEIMKLWKLSLGFRILNWISRSLYLLFCCCLSSLHPNDERNNLSMKHLSTKMFCNKLSSGKLNWFNSVTQQGTDE